MKFCYFGVLMAAFFSQIAFSEGHHNDTGCGVGIVAISKGDRLQIELTGEKAKAAFEALKSVPTGKENPNFEIKYGKHIYCERFRPLQYSGIDFPNYRCLTFFDAQGIASTHDYSTKDVAVSDHSIKKNRPESVGATGSSEAQESVAKPAH